MSNENRENMIDGETRNSSDAVEQSDLQGEKYIRISNERYARDSGLDERLSLEDRQMLSDMGIAF